MDMFEQEEFLLKTRIAWSFPEVVQLTIYTYTPIFYRCSVL